MRKILVCGGRSYNNWQHVWRICWELAPFHLIEGAASGADQWAFRWAAFYRRPHDRFHAEWGWRGRAAGVIRNGRMLAAKPDLVIAFPGGRGTEDMVARATMMGVPVRRMECVS